MHSRNENLAPDFQTRHAIAIRGNGEIIRKFKFAFHDHLHSLHNNPNRKPHFGGRQFHGVQSATKGGFANANKWPLGFVKWPLPLYRSAALVKVLLERLRRAHRALRVLRSTWTMLATQGSGS